ncbi:MAG: DNA polymerase I [Chlamydiales bacterium]|nr:DNA polymerase I [Chlamydiales bacterium]
MSRKIFILDVSGYLFRAYYALPHMSSPSGESVHAVYGFIRSVGKLIKDFNPQCLVAVFDGPDNKKQRKEIYEKYKSNRTAIVEDLPEQFERVKEYCELAGIPHVEVPGVEADDTIGSMAVWAAEQGDEVFICTSDKDLCQLVGKKIKVLNTWKDNLIVDRKVVEELYGVPPEKIVDLLAIMGDSSDNIPGLKGFGPKTAVPLLQEFGSLENLLKHPEKVKGPKKQETLRQDADVALLSKRLATIHTDVEFPKKFELEKEDVAGLKAFFLELGFNSLVRELGDVDEEVDGGSYHLVDDEKSLEKLIAKLEKAEEICFDVESTHVRPMLAELVGVGFGVKAGEAFYVPCNGKLGKERVLKALKPILEKKPLFAHNGKYDCHVLANEGIEVSVLSFDTILASYLLNSSSRRHGLDALSLQYFGKVKTPIKSLIGSGKKELTMDQVKIEKVSDYCCEDVDYTFRLKQIFAKEIAKRGFEELLFDLEIPLTFVLLEMERAGVYIDVEALEEYSKELGKDLRHLEKEIYALANGEFNINSPKQLSEVLFNKLGIEPLKKTATGLSTKAEVLEQLAVDYPICEKIIAYRILEKLRSTYVEALPSEVNKKTGRIHPTFNQFVTATGRLACQDPNLQNIPVRTAQGRRIREAFQPQERGWRYLAADYSQIELRLLAHLSGDPTLIKAFKDGEDIHAYTAALMFEVPIDKVTEMQRYQAKAINFGIIYGQQAFGLAKELCIEIKRAKTFIEEYFDRYPKVADYLNSCIEQTRKTGRSVTMTGRERLIPEITSSNAIVRGAAERLAVNTPLQGSSADLIKLAMLDISSQIAEMESFLILQVHDELIFEAPESELSKLEKIVTKSMEGVFSLKVPLVVDVNVGKNWGEC